LAGPLNNQAASQAFRIAQGKSADDSPSQQLFDFQDQGPAPVRNDQRFVESGKLAGERHIDY
jgi:hypothetical protein